MEGHANLAKKGTLASDLFEAVMEGRLDEINRIVGSGADLNGNLVQFRTHRDLQGSHIGGHIVCFRNLEAGQARAGREPTFLAPL